VVLLFAAGLAAALAVAAGWTRDRLVDEDTWAATGRALAEDPQVQQDVADAIATQVVAATGLEDTLQGVLPGPLGGLADPVTGRTTDLVSELTLQLVRTEAFLDTWDAAVRASHAELLAALDGEGRVTTIDDQGIALDLGATLGQLRQLLDDRGVTALDGIDLSAVDVQLQLVDAPGLHHLRDLRDVLDVLVVVLPIGAAVAGALGLVVARRRSVALAAAGVGALAGAGGVWLVARAGRDEAVRRLTGGVLGPGAATAVVDHVTASLEAALVVVALVGVGVVVLGSVVAVATSRR
jgi:hypothetical protein